MFNDDLDEKLFMIQCFIQEARELLDDVEPQICVLEKDALSCGAINKETLNKIFRLFHSLKGAASFLDFHTITGITHETETLLDIFRQGAIVTPGQVDLLIQTMDLIRNILECVEKDQCDTGFESEVAAIIDDLKRTIETACTNQLACSIEQEEIEQACPVITPEMTRRFVEETGQLLEEAEKALLALEKSPGNLEYAHQAFRALHSFKGNAGFFCYQDLEQVSHHAETLLDLIRESRKICDSVSISFLLISLDALRDGVGQISLGITPEIAIKEDLISQLRNLAKKMDETLPQFEQKPELHNLEEASGFLPDLAEEPLEEHLAEANLPQSLVSNESNHTSNKQMGSGQQQAIRVDIEKLDKLLDLVGELVIAEAMVANNQDMQNLQTDRFEKAVLQLDKITRDIQEVAMSMRMIPLAGTFRKMVRLVRDLSQKMNKKVNLEILGEETEVDKTIIEQISDPLVHLIRNAVDHGIEPVEERLAAGKAETGRVTIEAKHAAGEVWIIIQDDGGGLNREKILRRGIERGLISEQDQDLKDEEVWRLIFEPGFSTAEVISDISGRGVGMDVVKRNIERLRGKVDIRSRTGTGTMFVIRIPLTLAIIEGMVVKVGHSRYTIPILSIKESFQPRRDQITITPDNLEVVRIRGEILPVIRLHELYRVQPLYRQLTEGILIMVENDGKKCCLFVDELLGQQQIVIKGLSSYLGQVKSISGCAILGDGDISMILDIANLIESVENVAV